MHRIAFALLLVPTLAGAQTTIDSRGIRAPGVRIDSTGVHTDGADVTNAGVSATGRGGRVVTIAGNDARRSVNCNGGTLQISGNDNVLNVANCSSVMVAGNDNKLRVAFGASGALQVSGNDNKASWSAARGAHASVSNVGDGNSIVRLR